MFVFGRFVVALKHSVFVRGIFRHRLANVPKLDDAIALELENVNEGESRLAGLHSHAGMDGNQIAFLDGVSDFQHLVRIFRRVFFHPCHERFGVASKVSVVMAKPRRDVLLKGLTHIARGGGTEERQRRFFVRD